MAENDSTDQRVLGGLPKRGRKAQTISASPPLDNVVLVRRAESADTAAMFDSLWREALDGKIVGAIVIPLYQCGAADRPYTMRLSGLASENPTLALGATSACTTLLQDYALDKAGLI